MLALVDGDEVLYRAGFSSERNIYYVPEGDTYFRFRYKGEIDVEGDVITQKEVDSEAIAIHNLNNTLYRYLEGFEYDDYIIYLGGKNNFRHDIATILPYKGNRKDSSKPVHYDFLKDYLVNKYIIEYIEGMESDDGLSIAQWKAFRQGEDSCIVTQDKDLNMVPGWHHNPVKDVTFNLSEEEAMKFFYVQLLTGDSTDNIPGMFRITGKMATAKLKNKIKGMDDELDMYEQVLTCYEGDVKIVTEIGRLLWMKQDKDKDWNPGERHYDV
jgi:5'-3' exonuclease